MNSDTASDLSLMNFFGGGVDIDMIIWYVLYVLYILNLQYVCC